MLHAAIAQAEKVMALISVATTADGQVTKLLHVEVKKEVEIKCEWTMSSKYHEEIYPIQYSCIEEVDHHCLLQSPFP